MDRQLFVLSREIWSSISKEDIMATARSMCEANINNYPYEEFDIDSYGEAKDIFPWIFSFKNMQASELEELRKDTSLVHFRFRYYNFDGPSYDYSMGVPVGGVMICLPQDSPELLDGFPSLPPEDARYMNDMAADAMLNTLLVMLATRNVKKEVLHKPKRFSDPRSKNGVKQIRNKDYEYITTIKIGEITETMTSGDHRGPVRPHLRRGHLRNQRIGEGRKEVKQIFIQPVFVNADDGWIENQRKEYRVKL